MPNSSDDRVVHLPDVPDGRADPSLDEGGSPPAPRPPEDPPSGPRLVPDRSEFLFACDESTSAPARERPRRPSDRLSALELVAGLNWPRPGRVLERSSSDGASRARHHARHALPKPQRAAAPEAPRVVVERSDETTAPRALAPRDMPADRALRIEVAPCACRQSQNALVMFACAMSLCAALLAILTLALGR